MRKKVTIRSLRSKAGSGYTASVTATVESSLDRVPSRHIVSRIKFESERILELTNTTLARLLAGTRERSKLIACALSTACDAFGFKTHVRLNVVVRVSVDTTQAELERALYSGAIKHLTQYLGEAHFAEYER